MKTYEPRMAPELAGVQVVARDARVDWLTITANTEGSRKAIFKRWQFALGAMQMLGEEVREWGMRGYKGLQIGSIRWGSRRDDDILILSGQDAYALWKVFLPWATNCSRVDLAVTVETSVAWPNLLQTYADWIYDSGSKMQKRMTLLRRVDGIGQTLYVNKRSSDQLGRVYDKGAQLGLDDYVHRLWRYEVEYRRERANVVVRGLKRLGSDFPNGIYQNVYQWFNSRDIPPVFDQMYRDGWQIRADVAATITSTSTSLNWLSSQVRPTVARLRAAGLEEQVLDALGLT